MHALSNDEKRVLRIVLPDMPKTQLFQLNGNGLNINGAQLPKDGCKPPSYTGDVSNDLYRIKSYLIGEGFADLEDKKNFQTFICLTDKGRELKDLGSIEEFERIEAANQSSEAAQKSLAEKKLRLDVKNAERVYKSYWLTFGFAVFGAVGSLVLLILKILGK